MRGVSWRGKVSAFVALVMRMLNWAVTVSLLEPYPAWKRPGSVVAGRRSGEAVKSESGVSEEKRVFLEKFGGVYGYPGSSCPIDKLRAAEFSRLNGVVYVDHAGATLHADSQLKAALQDFSSNLYGNPHSQSDSSMRSSDAVEYVRQQVLAFCNAPLGEYRCVFTSGATSALKLVGETFPWSTDSEYWYTVENHNSVLGIREYALDQGVSVTAVDVEEAGNNLSDSDVNFSFRPRALEQRASSFVHQSNVPADESFNLFAFPLECNFSGAKFDLNLVKHVQGAKHVSSSSRGRWMVLLDAAKGCGTAPPDLTRFPADFVAISFYKIFGYPTGLGALLVRRDAATLLKKKYFGGGTVAMSIADADVMRKRDRVEQWLEDGTTSFLGIAALRHGFASIDRLELPNLNMHTGALTSYFASVLAGLKHENGAAVCVLHGNHGLDHVKYWGQGCNQGPVVTFNLKRADGSWVGHREVEKLAALENIQLRTGCFCNPGACAKYLKLSQEDLLSNFEAGHVCWDDQDVIHGKPTGAVRVSFGYMSTFEDCWAVTKFIVKYFVEISADNMTIKVNKARSISSTTTSDSSTDPEVSKQESEYDITSNDKDALKSETSIKVENLVVYPIKSCGGFSANIWPLSNSGLLYDREWMIQRSNGDVLTQKKLPLLCSIHTSIDLKTDIMHVKSSNMQRELAVSLQSNPECPVINGVKLCGNRLEGNKYGEEVAEWFTEALGVPCTLVRKEPKVFPLKSQRGRSVSRQSDSNTRDLSFANEGQVLLVSKDSVDELNRRVAAALHADDQRQDMVSPLSVDALRFRPNIVVSGADAHDEDNWQSIDICSQKFVVVGGCNRCQMVNVDQSTGLRESNQPLATLASYRRQKGQITFGILLEQDNFGVQNLNSTFSNELESEYVKWLRTRYPRLLSVGSSVTVLKLT
ncbi:hypothetical protein KC19_4G072700 [Ceratodon purpureus]|uniref:Molybdenum cofactor sulfurase n=1 Tax=Ceratodon purpureus TaxID=3225 RepID=A0A8T0I7Z0_CERPU|nr:hypothetical protein KC19_4G072700 [Ceratodon purpureus]